MSYDCFEMVREFHKKNNQVIGDGTQSVPVSTILLRQRLMLEELGELSIACHEADLEEIADAACDLLYVIYGTLVSLGTPVVDRWPMIDGSIAKLPSQVDLILKLSRISNGIGMCTRLICRDEAPEGIKAVIETDFLYAIMQVSSLATSANMRLEACFREVHRSNMTKQLGGASDGLKYGPGQDPKGAGFSPANLRPILGLPPREPVSLSTIHPKVEKLYGQPVFTLLAQDDFTQTLIGNWIYQANQTGVGADKIRSVMVQRDKIDRWRSTNPERIKVPD